MTPTPPSDEPSQRGWAHERLGAFGQMSWARTAYLAAVGTLTALIALSVLWELWLAPLRAGGSWLVLKAVPLLAPLFGVLRGRVYTYRWASLLVVVYFIEGCVRAYADTGRSALLAAIEVGLSLLFTVAAVAFIRSQPQHHQRASAASLSAEKTRRSG